MQENISFRRGLSFAQAEGVEPLPSQLEPKYISPELGAVLWAFVHGQIDDSFQYPGVYGSGGPYLGDPWKRILESWWIVHLHQNIDEMPGASAMLARVKTEMTSRDYLRVFGFLQFVLQRSQCPYQFGEQTDRLLQANRAAYRVIDGIIAPITSEFEADSIRASLAAAKAADAKGAFAHLRHASVTLSQGRWAESVRESIHAVEAVAKSIEPEADTLDVALNRLTSSIGLSPTLKKAFSALYGYSSDEEGIRHALVFDETPNVSEREALFMFGACSSFVGYLLSAERVIQ